MNPEQQSQLDELSGRNLTAKEMFAQSLNLATIWVLFAAMVAAGWLRNFCRGCQRDGNAVFSKTPGVSTTGAGPTSIEAGLPSPTTAPELLL